MIRQFTYTASPWGKSGAGWMVFQQSKDTPADLVKKLYGVYRYEESKSPSGEARHPVQFAYFPNASGGGAVLSQTTFTGMRWFGEPRPGDFFAHVFLLDGETVSSASESGFNPVRLYQSKKIQTAFPESLKNKALRIFRKEMAWEQPPALPELQSLIELDVNPRLLFNDALETIPECSIKKLGPLVRSIMLRTLGKSDKPIVFDSNNKNSPLFMSLALDLIPPSWRARTWFAVHFAEAALQRLAEYSSLTFYGTEVSAGCDLDSGIVSGVDYSQDPFVFRNRNDVRAFKQQLDSLGMDVPIENYKGLVDCRKVVTGGWTDLNALKSAVAFVGKFPGLKEKISVSLTSSLSGRDAKDSYLRSVEFQALSVAAYYELGLTPFEPYLRRLISNCTQDVSMIDRVALKIQEDTTRNRFIDEVVEAARKTNVATFVDMVVEANISLGSYAMKRKDGDLLRLAWDYREILAKFNASRIDLIRSGNVGRGQNVVERLEKIAGSNVKGFSEIKEYLKYCREIVKVRKVEDVEPVLRACSGVGLPKGVDVRRDILERVSTLSVRETVALGSVFDDYHLQGSELICEKWKKDQDEIHRLREKVRALEFASPEKRKKPGCILMLIVCLTCVGIGIFVGRKYWRVETKRIQRNDFFSQDAIMGTNKIIRQNAEKTVAVERNSKPQVLKKMAITNGSESVMTNRGDRWAR